MSITVYGIPNCDRVRAALAWLDRHGIAHRLHDVRADGLDARRLRAWAATLGAERLLNRRSATWRALKERPQQPSAAETLRLLRAHPTLLRRPLLETPAGPILGFDAEEYARTLLA